MGSLAATPFIASGRYDEAIVNLRKVLELAPGTELPWVYLQTTYEDKGDFPKAIDATR
jgi:tetratricopeptide (TPR) repeat protein